MPLETTAESPVPVRTVLRLTHSPTSRSTVRTGLG